MTNDVTGHDGPGLTVAAQDIARLADVGRAAVSNWRRRFPDFPEPVGGTAASPLYSLAEVEAWLTRHGRQFQLLPADRVWQQVRGAASDLRLGHLVGYLGAFLVFLRRDPKRWRDLAHDPDAVLARDLPASVMHAVPELPEGLSEQFDTDWIDVVRLVSEVADGPGSGNLFESICERYLQVHSRRYSVLTPPQLAEIMTDLTDASAASVLDPACGTGTLLLAAHAHGAQALHGQDVEDVSARLATVRLLLQDAPARIAVGDSLRQDAFGNEQVDVVVCNPPFNERTWGYDELTSDPRWEYGLPPRGEPELAWVQHCLARTKPGGRVVIAMPPAAASRRAGRRIRANLLRSGALQAVISLPGTPSIGTPTDIWVLGRPTASTSPSHLLMVDAAADPDLAAKAWRRFLAEPDLADGDAVRSMRILDLLDDEVDVSPTRHVSGKDEIGSGQFEQVRAQFAAAAQSLADATKRLEMSSDRPANAVMTIAELVKAGIIAIHQATATMNTESGEVSVLTAQDVRLGRAASGRAATTDGLTPILPGDVVLSSDSRELTVRVITEEGAALGPRLLLLRPDPTRLDPHFLAGFLQGAQAQAIPRGQSLLGRTDVRRASLPRMPIDAQREYGERFRQLTAVADALRHTTELGESMVRIGFAGLADGSVQPGPGSD